MTDGAADLQPGQQTRQQLLQNCKTVKGFFCNKSTVNLEMKVSSVEPRRREFSSQRKLVTVTTAARLFSPGRLSPSALLKPGGEREAAVHRSDTSSVTFFTARAFDKGPELAEINSMIICH